MTDSHISRGADPDAELVARAQAELPSGTGAYEELMHRHQRLIFAVCLRLLGNNADAEDVCQEVMIKVFGALKEFEGRSTFKTWLMSIVTNTCFSLRDRQKRSRQATARLSVDAAEDTVGPAGAAQVDAETLLRRLSDEDRKLMILRFVADLSFEEIAQIAGLGLSATKMRIYRATERLREMAGDVQQ